MTKVEKSGELKIDVWSKRNNCVVCEETCPTQEEKEEHEQKQTHKKKFSIYKFAKTYLKTASTQIPSALIRRFRISKEKPAGIECLNELRFSWAPTGWWICSICHESGSTFEQAENHIRSPSHLSKYLEEFAPEKATPVKKLKSNPIEYYTALIKARDELYETQGDIPPEIFELEIDKETATAELNITLPPAQPKETLAHNLGEADQANSIKRVIVKCNVCHEVIPCFRKNLNKVWPIHENTPSHRKASAISGILTHLPCDEIIDEDMMDEASPQLNFQWRKINGIYFGPICGKSFLLACGTQYFCLLCNCEVHSFQEHFSSEYHILRFLSIKKTHEIIAYHQQTGEVRRAKMLDLLGKITLDNDSHKKLNCNKIPDPILELKNFEHLAVEECLPPLNPFGMDAQCLICLKCHLAIKVLPSEVDRAGAIWNEHVQSPAHFDVLSRQSTYFFFDEFFVPVVSTVKSYPTEHRGQWKETSPDPKVSSYLTQTQCDVGLEWIVEDQESGEVVCTLCSRTYKKDNSDGINNHIRSYCHLNQYLNAHFTDFLALLSIVNSENAVTDLMMDWLQKTYTSQSPFAYDSNFMQYIALSCNWGKIRVYSPEKAASISKKMDVLVRTAELSYANPEILEETKVMYSIKDQLSNDGNEKLTMNLRQALMCSPCRIIYMDDEDNKLNRRWLLRCVACQLAFSTTVENLPSEVFEKHLHDPEHHRRIVELADFEKDRHRFLETKSDFTVKQHPHPDPKKPITWSHNKETKEYHFLLTVVGLEDLVDRKSSNRSEKTPDFFCRICAKSIPRRSFALENHVRSKAHVYNYVHQYFPMTVYELEKEKLDEGKIRQKLALALKGVAANNQSYCIPVYDPVGEMNRAAQEAAELKAAGAKEDNLIIMRKRAEEERMAKEAEKRRILDKQRAAKEKIRNEAQERERRIKEKDRKAYEEMARIREELNKKSLAQVQEAAAKARAFAIVQANKQKIENQVNELERERERVIALEIARLKDLKEKEAALEKEKMERQKKAELRNIAQKTQDLFNKVRAAGGQSANLKPPLAMPNMSVPPPGFGMNIFGSSLHKSVLGPKPGIYPMTNMLIPIEEKKEERARSPRRRSRSRSRDNRRSRSRSPSRGWKPTGLQSIPPATQDIDLREDTRKDPRSYADPVKQKLWETRPSLRNKTVDSIINDPMQITNRVALVDYIWKAGAEKIPQKERPHLYSEVARRTPGHLGIDMVFEVVCLDEPLLDTFYCSLCGFWNTPSEILKHLDVNEHKMAYMYRHERLIHDRINQELSTPFRAQLLLAESIKIWKARPKENQEVNCRLRTYLNKAIIYRLWPEHVLNLDHSWRNQTEQIQVPAPVAQEVLGGFNSYSNQQPISQVNLTNILPTNNIPMFNPSLPPPVLVQGGQGMAIPPQVAPVAPQIHQIHQHIPQIQQIHPAPPIQQQHLVNPVLAAMTSQPPPVISQEFQKQRSRSPRSSRKRSRSRDRRRSSSPKRRDPRRSRSSSREDRRRRSRERRRSRSRDRDRGYSDPKIINKDDIAWISQTERFLQNTQNPPQYQPQPQQPVGNIYSQPPPPYIPTPIQQASQKQKEIEIITIPDSPIRDDNYRRRVMALACNLEDEFGKHSGKVAPDRIKIIYDELGIDINDRQVEKTLQTIIHSNKNKNKKTINLAEYGIGLPGQQFQSYNYPPPNISSSYQQQKEDPDLQRILGGIKASLAQIRRERPVSPIVKPMSNYFSKTEDFFGKNTGINLTYPDNPEELEREKNEKLKRKKEIFNKIQESMNRLNERKDAINLEEGDEEEDWEGLANNLEDILGSKKQNDQPKEASKPEESPKSQQQSAYQRPTFGLPNSWVQPVPQPVKATALPAVNNPQENTPIAPGQKIPLQRTILPNGQLISQPSSSTVSTSYMPTIAQMQPSSSTYQQSQQYNSYNQQQGSYPPVYQPPQFCPPPQQNFSNPPPNFLPPGQYAAPPTQPGLPYGVSHPPPGMQQQPGPGMQQGYYGSYQQQQQQQQQRYRF